MNLKYWNVSKNWILESSNIYTILFPPMYVNNKLLHLKKRKNLYFVQSVKVNKKDGKIRSSLFTILTTEYFKIGN